MLTHKPYAGGPYIITEIVQNPGFGPAYRLTNAKSGKARAALVPSYRLKPFHSREALINKYQPEAKQTVQSLQQPTAGATPIALKHRSKSQPKASNKQTVSPTDKPTTAILQQKDDMYLVVYQDKSRSWVKRSPQLDSLLKKWLMKREISRQQRKRKTPHSAHN